MQQAQEFRGICELRSQWLCFRRHVSLLGVEALFDGVAGTFSCKAEMLVGPGQLALEYAISF